MPSLVPNGKQTFWDRNGEINSGGTVEMYAPGTLLPQATYQDRQLTIQNTNPVLLDPLGQCVMWGTGAYRQIVRDSSANIIYDQETLDPISTSTNLLSLDGTALQNKELSFTSAGVPRWGMFTAPDPNSYFSINRYDSSGVFLDQPIRIETDGTVSIANNIKIFGIGTDGHNPATLSMFPSSSAGAFGYKFFPGPNGPNDFGMQYGFTTPTDFIGVQAFPVAFQNPGPLIFLQPYLGGPGTPPNMWVNPGVNQAGFSWGTTFLTGFAWMAIGK